MDVAQHEPVDRELAADRIDGRDDPRIVRRQEADERHQQHARIELVRAVGLGERAATRVPGALEDLRLDLVPELAPPLHRALAPELLVRADGPVERHPRHHLGMREVAVRAAHLPDPGILAPPAVLEPGEQPAGQRPDVVVRRGPVHPGLVERVDHLAVDVQLQLVEGRVSDPNGP